MRPSDLAVLTACAVGACAPALRRGEEARLPHASPATAIPDAVRAIQELLDTLRVTPGLAVAIVAGDSVVLSQGFGLADVERRRPVTPRTRFYIASVTKAFTAAAVTRLAESGRVHLDSSAAPYLKGVRLEPPLTLDHISLRDLLTHRSGLSNPEATFVTAYSGDFTKQSLLDVFSESRPRSRAFAYSNVGYLFAGSAMEQASGKSWQNVIREEVLIPAGMSATGFSVAEVPVDSMAVGYASHWDGYNRVPPKSERTSHAAGGMVSNLEDLTRWLRINLHLGALGERQVFTPRLVASWHAPQAQVVGSLGGFARYAYGLGWYRAEYEGRDVVQVLGSYRGYRAHVSFMPKEQLGVVVLANEGKSAAFFPEVVAQTVYDRLLGITGFGERHRRRIEDHRNLIKRIRGTGPYPDFTQPIKFPSNADPREYAGVYEGGRSVKLEIRPQGGGLYAVIGDLQSYLEYRARDTLLADLTPGSLEGVVVLSFARQGPNGAVSEVTLDRAPGGRFRRVAQDRSVLRRELADCTVPRVSGRVQCGVFGVHEDPHSAESRVIELRIVILKAHDPMPAPDPIFAFTGGPGIGAAAIAAAFDQYWGFARRRRDMVLIDQRGTGGSNRLDCSSAAQNDLLPFLETLFPAHIVDRCRDELSKRADLTLYTTDIAVSDVEAVRQWLGYETIDVWGESYGTRVALEYVRQFGQHVRTAVLDAVAGYDLKQPLHFARDAQRALDDMFDSCARDAACGRAFPDLRDEFAELLKRWSDGPVAVRLIDTTFLTARQVRFPLSAFGYAVRGMLYGDGVFRLPLLIHRAQVAGDLEEFVQYYARRATWFGRGDHGGIYLSIVCAEDVARIGPEEVGPLTDGTFLGGSLVRQYMQACSQWPRGVEYVDHDAPIRSHVPVLLLSGGRDPVTPPRFAETQAATLQRSLLFTVPGGGHGVSDRECVRGLILELLDSGNLPLSPATCPAGKPDRPFVTRDSTGS